MNTYKYHDNGREITYIVCETIAQLNEIFAKEKKCAYIDGNPEFDYAKLDALLSENVEFEDVELTKLQDFSEVPETCEDLFLALNAREMTQPEILSSYRVIVCCAEVFSLMQPRFYFSQITSFMRIACMKDASFYEWLIENLYEYLDMDRNVLYEAMDECGKAISFFFEKYPKKEWHKYLDYALGIEELLCSVVTDAEIRPYEIRALAMIVNAHLSHQHNRISLEEYLEIRDMMVPFHQPITIESMCLNAVEDAFSGEETMKITMMRHLGKLCFNDFVSKEEMIKAIEEIYYEETND